MTDHLTKAKRSWNMSHIRSKNTKPEIIVRSLLHRMGYRFRIHQKNLPGKPDIVLAKYKTIIFIHGCFWHRHKGCKRCTTPSTNQKYWLPKLGRNIVKDKLNKKLLKKNGWLPIIVWECEIKKLDRLAGKINKLLKKQSYAV
jgi:DNA mismatch endonuclease (patch repair protein)